MAQSKLVINVVLEGAGTVELRNLRLVQGKNWMTALYAGAWWGPRTSGFLGGILGTTAGLVGALIGISLKSPKHYAIARAGSLLFLVSGVVSSILATWALVIHQPGYVSWMFLLFGVIGLVVGGDTLRKVNQKRTQAELRRMDAADAAGGIDLPA